ncbi:hypothetical protein GGTG_06632 [Gaeumannomyces tritici R3-111a-1]|uniref:Uncharacterized protein n=1 Tax=Gaeumannomyces tritici (strain R3-111a-1) TaxID=644352 RepID=J3NZD3_GAET3|nr:hypothetical protein GGTG_06632 [Gaeumannomyces tritici R3-111a-1]EJT76716.1 hypothetical protein GGTG_06632 [Gaeumannomyces tritici R3-111a-1]
MSRTKGSLVAGGNKGRRSNPQPQKTRETWAEDDRVHPPFPTELGIAPLRRRQRCQLSSATCVRHATSPVRAVCALPGDVVSQKDACTRRNWRGFDHDAPAMGLGDLDFDLGWLAGWSFCIGLLHAGYASSTGMTISMAEEDKYPSAQVSKAMVMAIVINTIGGLLFLAPLMFVLLVQPTLTVFKSAAGSPGAAIALPLPLMVLAIFVWRRLHHSSVALHLGLCPQRCHPGRPVVEQGPRYARPASQCYDTFHGYPDHPGTDPALSPEFKNGLAT